MARYTALADWLAWQEQFHPRPIDLGLERVTSVFTRLADKPKPVPTITVAGTNGKGSCVAMLEAIYRAQGYRVGCYTSPHILRYNERIRVDGEAASDEAICAAFERIDAVRADISLSYFEFGTLAALDIFSRAGVDVRILEVGLGGRLDAVNMIDADAALVTTIAIDHVDWLGHTLDAIGREKAGVFRAHQPAVIGDRQVPDSLLQAGQEKQAMLLQLGVDFDYQKHSDRWHWRAGTVELIDLPFPALQGEHQFYNASAAIMVVTSLQQSLPVKRDAIVEGLTNVKLSGRFQLVEGEIPVLMDVGHNPQAVQTLNAYLQTSFPNAKIHAVFAMMKDKDILGVLEVMRNRVAHWYLAPLKNPRAATAGLLQSFFQQLNMNNVNAGYPDFTAAFNDASNRAEPGDLILVFGSFFLVSEYLSQFA